ncbi:MAG: glycoside hydrolase family 65 protein [Candidatus Brocadiia bacterium]
MSDAAWAVSESPWQPEDNLLWEARFTTGNGYCGVRGFPEEPFDAGPSLPGIYIAGVFDPDADDIPELVNVANFLSVALRLAGRPVRLAEGRVRDYERVLDLRRGILYRRFTYVHGERQTRLQFERFASLTAPHLVSQSIEVKPLNWRGDVALTFWLDARVRNRSKRHLRFLHSKHVARDRVLLATETSRTRIRIGHACRSEVWVRQARPPKPAHVGRGSRLGLHYQTYLEPCQQAVFSRTTATYTSRDPDVRAVERDCLDAIRNTAVWRCGVLRRRHSAAWRRRWRHADVRIDGPEEDQRAIRFVTLQLIQAASRNDPTVSIGAKALSGEAYRGHVFWDTEIFMLPFFIYAFPATAKRLLTYRYLTLDGARKKARDDGYRGAMFAWESAATGEETCPRYVPDPKTGEPVRVWTGELEQHISADVVYGAWHYWRATGDERFRRNVLTPIAVETARFWASRVEHREDHCVVRDVIGPDEYHEHVDDNAFTNYMAAWNLRLAASLAPDDADAPQWRETADRILVPYDAARGIIEQHQGFLQLADADPRQLSSRVSEEPEKIRMARIWKSQILKQADVVMLMNLWPDAFPNTLKRANWDYYEPRTTHDSSLSSSGHAILAADLELKRKAYHYFRLSASTDLANPMGNTQEGLHAAALGGTWQAVVRGFLGIRSVGEALRIEPRLPRPWQSVSLRVAHRGAMLAIEASRDEVRVEKLSGRSPSTVQVAGYSRSLRRGESAVVALR